MANNDLPDFIKEYQWSWNDLARDLFLLKELLEPIALPSPKDLKEHRTALRYSGKGLLDRRFESGEAPYYFPGDRKYQAAVRLFNRHLKTSGADWSIVERAIETQSFSIELIRAWGRLHELLGRRDELQKNQKAAKALFEKQSKAANANATAAQHTWFARWVLQRSPRLDKDSRKQIADDLAELCREIVQTERQPPPGFTPAWFSQLISLEESQSHEKTPQKRKRRRVPTKRDNKPVYIIPSLTRLGPNKIKQLAENPKIPPSRLPPLDEKKFPK